MGRNGSGKTTLLKHLVGLLKPDRGKVEIAGPGVPVIMDTRQTSVEEIIRVVGYVPQNPNALLFSDTVRQELDFTRRGHRLPPGDYGALLDTLGLTPHADRYPRDLSVGERQRVALAAILVAEPQILLLDEPMAGMNVEEKQDMCRFILDVNDQLGTTIVLIEHDMGVVMDLSDRVVVLDYGRKIGDGPPDEIKNNPDVITAYLGAQH